MSNWIIRIYPPSSPLPAVGEDEPLGYCPMPWVCTWSWLLGMYMADRMTGDQRRSMEKHLSQCQWCVCHMSIYKQALTETETEKGAWDSLSFIARQWLQRD